MTLNGIAQADELWRSIRREAENVYWRGKRIVARIERHFEG